MENQQLPFYPLPQVHPLPLGQPFPYAFPAIPPLVQPQVQVHSCGICNMDFDTIAALEGHCQSTPNHRTDLAPFIAYTGCGFDCIICNRSFRTYDDLREHCRNTTRHEWCEHCQRIFSTAAAKRAHLDQSRRHNVCFHCPQPTDFSTLNDLVAHLRTVHFYCSVCKVFLHDALDFQFHNAHAHNTCGVCGMHFRRVDDFQAHCVSHRPRTLRCFGCPRTFRSLAAVLFHIESGNCHANVTIAQVNAVARDFFRVDEYMVTKTDGSSVFICPACLTEFDRLPALYQHAERIATCSHNADYPGCLGDLGLYLAANIH